MLSILGASTNIIVNDLAEHFDVSVATIRRDLTALEEMGKLKRVYGGAVPIEYQPKNYLSFNTRITSCTKEKDAIAKKAAGIIEPDDTILLGMGTTTLELAKNLKTMQNLTVLSNSLPIINELVDSLVTVFALGGRVRLQEFSIIGNLVMETLKSFHIDKAVLGCGGFSIEAGITEYSYDVAQLNSHFIEHCDKAILVTDSRKFGKNVSVKVENSDRIDTIITDSNISEEWVTRLTDKGFNVIVAQV
jgi:DeoR/GlpR family transcriptional regulator of sugar metabolism